MSAPLTTTPSKHQNEFILNGIMYDGKTGYEVTKQLDNNGNTTYVIHYPSGSTHQSGNVQY